MLPIALALQHAPTHRYDGAASHRLIVAFAVAMLWLALTFNVPWAMGILLLVVVIGFWIVDHPDSYLRRRRAP